MIPEERIQGLIDTIVNRGGYIKNLHGQKNIYYQVNSTFYSALGEDDKKMLVARALQLFMPGKPGRYGILICLPVKMIMRQSERLERMVIRKSTEQILTQRIYWKTQTEML